MFATVNNDLRVSYALKRRDRDPSYLVCFRGPDGKRKERSTREPNQKRAHEAANGIIKRAYGSYAKRMNWDDAIALAIKHMKAQALRPGTIAQYKLAVAVLHKQFLDTFGPADISAAMAEDFKVNRSDEVEPRTVEGNIKNLSIVYGHWWRDTCKILKLNPFEGVEPPKYDKAPPRVIQPEEQEKFFAWLAVSWPMTSLSLFLKVKAAIGCRIGELSAATTLKAGRIYFTSETTKGRKQRACRLPTAIFAELEAIVGKEFVFQAFADQLRKVHRDRGRSHLAKVVKDYSPDRLVNWLHKQHAAYLEETGADYFKLHNFRGTAMSRARMAGVGEADAAIAFGCTPGTMRKHYLDLDEEEIADKVFDKVNGAN